GNYAPNLFVSALCVRGRVAGAPPTALVDLGKPAFKLGIAEIKVGWKDHELKVAVSPERDVYRIREKATVKVKVRTAAGKFPPRGTEVALAAVDEGLLELMPNASWKLLEAMMTRRGYEVRTATAQMQVVGKRHYGLKALPAGGGGGKQTTRELFDTLLLWKARVKLNERGEAAVAVPLNDALSSFRIVAVANGSYGLFGTGQASIRTTQDLMLLSGLPPLVREGDSFHAGFTARNASPRPMEVNIAASATAARSLAPLSLSLQPGEARNFGWDVAAMQGVAALSWEITARERSGGAADTLKVKQKVIAAVPVATYQATIAQVRDALTMEIEKPQDAQA
ncbi:MAG: alpha-2-macroglobulin family protein, partial [Dehalococcoidia bacterium]|nr:alpha-2-macroglobulin family protein [Dehalococcoidia bacterium]